MANKDFEVTITLTMEVRAETQAKAEERGELLAQAATEGIYDSPYRWKPEDIDAPTVLVQAFE